MAKKSKQYTPLQVLEKLRNYCAYQERCHMEVRFKLLLLGMKNQELENILTQLIEEGFLDEMRFAKSFARGKFRNKKWGRNRIVKELKKRQIGQYLIEASLKEIDSVEYQDTLQDLLERKAHLLPTNLTNQIRRQKLFAFAYQKGFETDHINSALNLLDYSKTK